MKTLGKVALRSFSAAASKRSLGFPVAHSPGQGPNAIFAHGLGSAWDQPGALALERHAKLRGTAFTRFEYRFVGDFTRQFHLDNWTDDLLALVEHAFSHVGHPQIIIAPSIGAVSALRVALGTIRSINSYITH